MWEGSRQGSTVVLNSTWRRPISDDDPSEALLCRDCAEMALREIWGTHGNLKLRQVQVHPGPRPPDMSDTRVM